MRGVFSVAPLARLIESEANVAAVVVPGDLARAADLPRRIEPPPPDSLALNLIPAQASRTIIDLAWEQQIPIWEVGKLTDRPTLKLLTELRPDLIVVACFSRIFPRSLLRLPKHGCLNLHPSLLPAYRGPLPLFWVFRNGEPRTGVTLHFLDEGIDSGPIISQTAFDLPDGLSELELTQRCAAEGADLLAAAVRRLATGRLPRRPQSAVDSSYFPAPSGVDFLLPTTWPARRAFNFLRGANTFPLLIEIASTWVQPVEAIGYDPHLTLPSAYQLDQDLIAIQFTPGVLHIRGRLIKR
jgi:methionyl-tRNA formyltransferase